MEAQKDTRAMFTRELRGVEKRPCPEMQLLLQILGRCHPIRLKARPNAKDPDYEELVTPHRMREFSANMSGIGSLLNPNQEMDNYISLELARGRIKVPDYTPFIVSGVSPAHWAIASKEHIAAVTRWRASDRKPRIIHSLPQCKNGCYISCVF